MVSEQEINRIIAEFMGYKLTKSAFHEDTWFANSFVLGIRETAYTKSLDAQIPLIEKLAALGFSNFELDYLGSDWSFNMLGLRTDLGDYNHIGADAETMPLATSKAFAKAILELEKETK